MTTAETPDLALDSALFMRALNPGDRELRLIKIVRAQRDEPVGLHALATAQHLLDRTGQVVIAQQTEYPTEPVERLNVRLQERLLGAVRERHRKRRTRMTRAHMEQVDLARDTSHRDLCLTPIDLGLHARLTHLRHERLNTLAPLPSTTVNIFPDRSFSDISSVLITQALPDPLRGMTLLARRITIPIKPTIDQLSIRTQLRCRATSRLALDRRQRRDQRLAHRPAMNAISLGQRPDRQALPIPVPPDLLERLHS